MKTITYCDHCGVLVQAESLDGAVECPDCRAGRKKKTKSKGRDSSYIDYSKILRDLKNGQIPSTDR